MKEDLPGWHAPACSSTGASFEEAVFMLHAGLDLSRKRLDVCLLSDHAEVVEDTAAPPDADGCADWLHGWRVTGSR